MLIAYVDDSGDPGSTRNKSTKTYTLGCLLVNDKDWKFTLDSMIEFRQRIKNKYGISVRSEIKANFLLHNEGDLKKLSLSNNQRGLIYRAHMRELNQIGCAQAFSVVTKKSWNASRKDIFETTWLTLFQRLERTSRSMNENILLVHDDGENEVIKRLTRKSRRSMIAGSQFGNNLLKVPFNSLIEDPITKQSEDSYFIQFADLIAFAAFRKVIPSSNPKTYFDGNLWDSLGTAIFKPANKNIVKTAPGIVEIMK